MIWFHTQTSVIKCKVQTEQRIQRWRSLRSARECQSFSADKLTGTHRLMTGILIRTASAQRPLAAEPRNSDECLHGASTANRLMKSREQVHSLPLPASFPVYWPCLMFDRRWQKAWRNFRVSFQLASMCVGVFVARQRPSGRR